MNEDFRWGQKRSGGGGEGNKAGTNDRCNLVSRRKRPSVDLTRGTVSKSGGTGASSSAGNDPMLLKEESLDDWKESIESRGKGQRSRMERRLKRNWQGRRAVSSSGPHPGSAGGGSTSQKRKNQRRRRKNVLIGTLVGRKEKIRSSGKKKRKCKKERLRRSVSSGSEGARKTKKKKPAESSIG